MFSVSAAAEFYKYVDEDGNVRFTDDINQVPAAQRAKIHSYVESVSEDPPEQEATQKNQANQADQAAADQQTNFPDLSDEEQQSLGDAKKQIEKLKSEMDQEYETLLKEKYGAIDIPDGSADVILSVDGKNLAYFVNGSKVIDRTVNQLDPGTLSFTVLSGTNRGFGTRCSLTDIGLVLFD